VQALKKQLGHAVDIKKRNHRERLTDLSYRLQNQDPDEPLKRGYTRIFQNGRWIQRSGEFNNDAAFTIQWRDKELSVNE
jgi:exodeoxyribonuclease VII large subunit